LILPKERLDRAAQRERGRRAGNKGNNPTALNWSRRQLIREEAHRSGWSH